MNRKSIFLNYIVIVFFMSLSIGLLAQNESRYSINIKYKESFIGKALLGGASFTICQNTKFQPSLRVQLNTVPKYNDGRSFYQTMKAISFSQYFGFDVKIVRYTPFKELSILPFIFISSEFGRMSRSILKANDIWTGKKTNFETIIPLKMLCNTVGGGVSFPVTQYINFNIDAGFGIGFIWDIDDRVIVLDKNPYNQRATEYVWDWSFSLSYDL